MAAEVGISQAVVPELVKYTTYPDKSIVDFATEWPQLNIFLLDVEINHHCVQWVLFTRRHYWIAPAIAALYMLFCFLGPRVMKNREAFDLKTPLKWWNLFLATFSFFGASRVLLQLAAVVYRFGFTFLLTAPPPFTMASGPVGLWTGLFVYSKIVELVDTIFIVLRKRELSFLHWYHHVTVLLYTWDAFVVEQPVGVTFFCINIIVHAVMYFYYFLTSHLGRRLSWGLFVTIAQISQMFVGVAITLYALYLTTFLEHREVWTREEAFTLPGRTHHFINNRNLYFSCAMYSTYVYLFVGFFVSRYVVRRRPHGKSASAKEGAPAVAAASSAPTDSTQATTATIPRSPLDSSEMNVESKLSSRGKSMSDISNSTRSSDDDEADIRLRRHKAGRVAGGALGGVNNDSNEEGIMATRSMGAAP